VSEHGEHAEHGSAVKVYARTWLGLIALGALSLGIAELHLAHWSMPIALVIAALKALLIGLFFMHLLHARAVFRVAVFTAVAFIALLAGLMAADIATRHDALPAGPEALPALL
jgi:cytochrome c oxidase subunit 4